MWKYILIGIGVIILLGVGFFVFRNYTGIGKNIKGNLNEVTAGSLLTGNDAVDYLKLSADMKAVMDCAEDGGDSERCPPNWRDNGATRSKISPERMAQYNEQLASTEYTNDDIRKVVARNTIYHWRYQLKAKNAGRVVSVPVYEALFDDAMNGLI